MTKISSREDLEARRQKFYNLYKIFNHSPSEIAAMPTYSYLSRRTIANDIAFMKKKEDEEDRRRAEQMEHEALQVIRVEKAAMQMMKRQALTDLSQLSMMDEHQRDYRLEMFDVLGRISDSRVELALMSDRIGQREALQRIKTNNERLAGVMGRVEAKTGLNGGATATAPPVTEEEEENKKYDYGVLSKESQIV